MRRRVPNTSQVRAPRHGLRASQVQEPRNGVCASQVRNGARCLRVSSARTAARCQCVSSAKTAARCQSVSSDRWLDRQTIVGAARGRVGEAGRGRSVQHCSRGFEAQQHLAVGDRIDPRRQIAVERRRDSIHDQAVAVMIKRRITQRHLQTGRRVPCRARADRHQQNVLVPSRRQAHQMWRRIGSYGEQIRPRIVPRLRLQISQLNRNTQRKSSM